MGYFIRIIKTHIFCIIAITSRQYMFSMYKAVFGKKQDTVLTKMNIIIHRIHPEYSVR